MKKIISFLLILTLSFSFLACGGDKRTTKKDDSDIVKKEEAQMTATEKEYEALIGNLSAFPVNFVYGDICYSGFAPSSFQEKSRTDITKGSKRSVVINFSLDETLSVILDTAFYKEYNAYEWTVYFKNENNDKASKTVKYVNAGDMYFKCENPVLKGLLGDHVNQYKPYEYDLKKESVNFTSTLGRASHVYFPYFNLETDSGGMMLALGWAGTWQADFSYDKKEKASRFTATGTVGLNTYLKPGECIRTPLVTIMRYYERDEDVATNAWRKWYLDCNMPHESATENKVVQSITSVWLANDTGRPNSDGSISEYYGSWKRSLDALYDNGIYADYRWFDAGWYSGL